MKILIDAMGIRKKKAGVGVYGYNLIKEILALDSANTYYILAQSDDPDLDFASSPNVRMIWIHARIFRSIPLRLLFEQMALPWLLLRHRIDIVHSLHYTFPLVRFRARRVVTLHDMTYFQMPDHHVPAKTFFFRFFIRFAVRWADAIIFVSRSTQKDCVDLLGAPTGKSFVVHHGKDQRFRRDPENFTSHLVRQRYGIAPAYILYIGTIEPRKNLSCLISAFAKVSVTYPDFHLVLAGMKGWGHEFGRLRTLVQDLRLDSRVVFPGFVTEEDKPLLLSAATVFVYPSLYEGFGLPVLEAMASGTATVTSNTSSMPEIAGDGALLVDPTDEVQLRSAIDSVLADVQFRKSLQEKALDRARQFTWSKTAAETIRVYELTVN